MDTADDDNDTAVRFYKDYDRILSIINTEEIDSGYHNTLNETHNVSSCESNDSAFEVFQQYENAVIDYYAHPPVENHYMSQASINDNIGIIPNIPDSHLCVEISSDYT